MQKILSYIIKFLHKLLLNFGIGEKTRFAIVKYLFNTAWMFAEKILFMAVAFFVGVYVARYLGPTQYGILSYAFSFVFIFQAVAKLGLDGIATRELVKKPDKKNEILGTSVILKAIGSIISLLLVFISLQFTSSDYETKIMVMIIAVGMLFNTFEVGRFFFESQVKAKFSAIANSIAIIVGSGLKVFLIIFKADLIWFAVAFSVEIIIRGIGFIAIYQLKYKDVFKWKFNKNLSKSLLRDSWALMLSSVAVMLYMKIDQVMIKEMLDSNAVGQYAAAAKISEIWYFIPVVISSSLFPAIIQAKKKGRKFYEKRLQQLYNLMTIIALFITIPVFLFSNKIILFLYGESYSIAGEVLQIHILSLLFVFWGQASGKWLVAENFVKISMFRTIVGAVFNILLNVFLIKYYNVIGAAFATLFSYMIAGYIFDVFNKKTHIALKMKSKSIFFLK